MRDRKPQKGPVFMSAAVAVFALIFSIFWTVTAFTMGAGFFSIFGLFFAGFAVAQLVVTLRHASGTDNHSHPKPPEVENRYAKPDPTTEAKTAAPVYCPSCGAKADADDKFCHECGRKLPERK